MYPGNEHSIIFPPVGFEDKEFGIESDCSRKSGEDREKYGHSSNGIRNRVGVHKIWDDPRRRWQSPKHGALDWSRCQALDYI